MSEIILWGTGKIANRLLSVINDKIILVVDNDEEKWESIWNGYVVKNPECLKNYKKHFDKIVIAVSDWKPIRKQIINDLHIDQSIIENSYYRQKEILLKHYAANVEVDKGKYISFLKKNPLEVFNDEFVNKYEAVEPVVYFDVVKSFYYIYYNGKKMYFPSVFSTEEQVKKYYRSLLIEQDKNSPHRYQTEKFHVCEHETVLDAGVAEGNFALDIIDLVDKLYLVEADKEWIKALQCTFEPYKNKVEIVEGILGNGLEEITIDSIIGDKKIDFIKMDIEGGEWKALCGAEHTLRQGNIKLDICVYHNYNDEKDIKKILGEMGYTVEVSEGYMIFITEKFYEKKIVCPKFVRGLIRAQKGT